MNGLRFLTGTSEMGDQVHEFLLDHFRVMEPITTSIKASRDDVFEFFIDLRDGALKNEKHSIVVYDENDELVGISLNYVKEIDENKENFEEIEPFNPHKDYQDEIQTGAYESKNANRLVTFVENVENNLVPLLTKLDHRHRRVERIFKIDVICVHPSMKGKGLAKELMKRIFEKAVEADCDVVAACATAQASQAIFRKFGFATIREVPFWCFRENHLPIYRDLSDKGLSGKLMAKWIK
ncbi:unnamed protein product, partial [Mesorhabditis belari]|uniref:aralkylamine N-acetyltransferase n=1 Tax=Mesorhabditis belari TaxID=2138241 RepID=A0AAF3ELP1_9BILA